MGFDRCCRWWTDSEARTDSGPQQGVQYADRLAVTLVDDIAGDLVVACADVESIGGVMRASAVRWRQSRFPAAAPSSSRQYHRRICPSRRNGPGHSDAILHGVVPAGVLGVAAAGHGAVIADVGKGIAAAGRIVLQHHIGTERALTAEGQRAVFLRRYAAIVFVIEGLARARAVDGFGILARGRPLS